MEPNQVIAAEALLLLKSELKESELSSAGCRIKKSRAKPTKSVARLRCLPRLGTQRIKKMQRVGGEK
jgi:hypothetical protein